MGARLGLACSLDVYVCMRKRIGLILKKKMKELLRRVYGEIRKEKAW